jgi:hypothetical protein
VPETGFRLWERALNAISRDNAGDDGLELIAIGSERSASGIDSVAIVLACTTRRGH